MESLFSALIYAAVAVMDKLYAILPDDFCVYTSKQPNLPIIFLLSTGLYLFML